MSSPLARAERNFAEQALVSTHQALSHGTRVALLAEAIDALLARHAGAGRNGALQCVDVGCGDFSLSGSIRERGQARGSTQDWCGLDLYPLDEVRAADPAWDGYRQFDGAAIPLPDASVDVVLMCDMLHHASPGQQVSLAQEAARVCRDVVIVKDHFEYGPVSRQMLRLMDAVGNWGYGVSVPDRYFDVESFAGWASSGGLTEIERVTGIELYRKLGPLQQILRPEWQFLSVLRRA